MIPTVTMVEVANNQDLQEPVNPVSLKLEWDVFEHLGNDCYLFSIVTGRYLSHKKARRASYLAVLQRATIEVDRVSSTF